MNQTEFEKYHINKIWNMDCVEYMQSLPDKCIDLTLTDFPYGVNVDYDTFEDSQEKLKELVDKSMPEILRISQRVLVTCGVINIGSYPKPNWILNWYNKAGAGSSQWGFTTWQPILAYGQCPYLQNRMGRRADTIEFNESSEKNGHPCPKPINSWVKILLRGSVKETDIIFDPFMGSGTTALACLKTNRKYIGCEISKKYCDIAEKRIKEFTDQTTLF